MMTFFKKFFLYVLNVLAISCVIFLIIFSTYSIMTVYRSLTEINYNIEKEYNGALDKYKKIIIFVLKNHLPQDINYFNLVCGVAYNLPSVKYLSTSESKNSNVRWDSKKIPNGDDNVIVNCRKGKCIKIFIEQKKIFNVVLSSKWKYGEIAMVPIKRTTLLKVAIDLFLENHKKPIIVILLCFFVLYLSQYLFLLKRNSKLTKAYIYLLNSSKKNKLNLIKQTSECDKLRDNLLFAQELVGEYFTYYVYQLIARNIDVKEMDVINALSRVEKFLGYQITKSNLKIILDYDKVSKIVKSDDEIIFIILLNLVFKAIFRSKIFSEITIRIFQMQDAVNIEISYAGYDYNPEINGKIQVCALPSPVLEELCNKVKMKIEEFKKNELNIISARVVNSEFTEIKEINKGSDNLIRIRLTSL